MGWDADYFRFTLETLDPGLISFRSGNETGADPVPRRPLGERAMTDAERLRRWRERKREERLLRAVEDDEQLERPVEGEARGEAEIRCAVQGD
jgi:hypothetical protein